MNDLDDTRSICIQEQMLGTIRTLRHRGREVRYRLPQQIEERVTIRFKGYGKKAGEQSGDLLLNVRVDRGQGIHLPLWLAASEAASGSQKRLQVGRRRLAMNVPPGSQNGEVVNLAGAGRKTPFEWGLPFFGRKKGNLQARLCVFPDTITPVYGAVDKMSNEDLTIEGWVYRKIDLLTEKVGRQAFQLPPFTASQVAVLFNEGGWPALANTLRTRFGLRGAPVSVAAEANLPVPGRCRRLIQRSSWGTIRVAEYAISIRNDFLDDPFAVVSILAHEMCHAIYSRCIAPRVDHVSQPSAELLEEERTVDLLVFMFQLGEFQMRVARKQHLTFGYFNQTLFERMHVILSRKRQDWQATSASCSYCGRICPAPQSVCPGCGTSLAPEV